MSNFFLVIISLGAGIIIARLRMLPRHAYKSINAWVLYVALPAMALRYLPGVEWNRHLLLPGLAPLVVWSGSWLFATWYAKRRNLDNSTRTALTVSCGLCNTGFIGLPLVGAYYGEAAIQQALLVDQATLMVFSTLAVITVLKNSAERTEKISLNAILKRLFLFPPFLICIFALVSPLFVDLTAFHPLFDKFAATVSPLAIFSIGLQLRLGEIGGLARILAAGLTYKLLIAPALVLACALLLRTTTPLATATIFESAMPPHIMGSLLASQYKLNPKLCTLLVGCGIIACFATTALWWFILRLVY